MANHNTRVREILKAPPLASQATVPVLILKIGQYALHDTHGLGIVRSLGRLGVPVYAVVEDRFTATAVSRYLTGAFIWDTRRLNAHQLLEGMATIGDRLNRPAILIPTDDAGAVFVAEEAATLKRWFLFPQQPAGLPRVLANKREMYFLCQRLGVACPQTVFPGSIADVREFVRSAAFPVVVKVAERRPGTGRTAWIAHTPDELYAIYRSAEQQPGTTLILQEYIPPAHGEDWFYHGYRNEQSRCCIGFTGRKFRSHPPFAGHTTLGRAVVNEPLRQQVEALLQTLSYSGITDLDLRLDKRDGRYKLLDFNPRVGAQFRLFESPAGLDVVRALYLDLTGQPVNGGSRIEGRTFIVEPFDLLASLGYFRRGALTPREWWLSFQGTQELAWFSTSDILPFPMLCFRLLLKAIQGAFGLRTAPNGSGGVPRYVRGFRRGLARRTPETVSRRSRY